MESIIKKILFKNSQAKIISLVAAIIIWIFVNQSLISSKTIPNTSIRIINIPADKTIIGLQPNNYLSHRVTLTLSGSKDVIDNLERGDLEVILDASIAESNDWVVKITKKNIVSLNPSLDLRHHLSDVSHTEFVIKFSQLVTEKIPIIVKPPVGNAPQGYEYLGVWPEKMYQIISGPKEEIQNLKIKGLRFTPDLDKIAKADLDNLKQMKKEKHDDEVSFYLPDKWKQVAIPFRQNMLQSINDPDARNFRIDFLRRGRIPLDKKLPVYVYYPQKYLHQLNPDSLSVAEGGSIKIENNLPFIIEDLYADNVSKLFLDVVRDNIVIFVVAAPQDEKEFLEWSAQIINPHEMENTYVAYFLTEQKSADSGNQEQIIRKRFKSYLSRFRLVLENGEKFSLSNRIEGDKIHIKIAG